ncbi:MAG: hypothetical protein AB1500_12000 [Bacillota bacterium]
MIKKFLCLYMVLFLCLTAVPVQTQAAAPLSQVIVRRVDWSPVKSKVARIDFNLLRIRKLNAAIKEKSDLLGWRITAARRNPERLTPDKLVVIREGLDSWTRSKKALVASQEELKKRMTILRLHKRTGNVREALRDLDGVLAAQEEMIKNQRAISAAMDNLIAAF